MVSLNNISQKDWTQKTTQQVLDAVGRPYDKHLFVDNKPGSLTAIGFHYPEEGWLYIYVTNYQHMLRFNIERNWDLEKFKLEMVDRVTFEKE